MKSALFLLGLLLHGLALAAEPFSLNARISVRHHEAAYHGSLSWQHSGERDTLFFAGPFGQGAAELRSDRFGAELRLPDGMRQQAESLDALAEALFGLPLPITQLAGWVQGIAPDAHLDTQARPSHLSWQGWLVSWLRYAEDGRPQLMQIEDTKGEMALRMRIDNWDRAEEMLP